MSLSASSSLSVRPSVRPPVWARLPVARFSRNLTLGGGLWWKYVQQFQVWLKSDRNIGHSARRRTCVSPWQHYETLCSVRTVRAPSGVSAALQHHTTQFVTKSKAATECLSLRPPPPALHSGVDLRFQYNPPSTPRRHRHSFLISYSHYLHILFNVISPFFRGIPHFLIPSIIPVTCFGTLL